MSLKEVTRAGESGGRKAAVREELLPSQHPLPKPTRDVSASNRSHSLTQDDPPPFASHRRLLLDREAEQADLERQANVLYTRQFRTLAKLLGNEGMEFEELREKVEGLVLERPSEPALAQRIQTLEWELARRAAETRSQQAASQQHIPSQEYLRGLETELGRKSKMLTELSDSIKREAVQEVVRELQAEIEAKSVQLVSADQQAQETRLRTNAALSLLEQELIRHKQTIQKLTFELDSQKRRAQTAADDADRLRKRERELTASLESEGKAAYQGLSYSAHALLRLLQTRDEELSSSLADQHLLQQDHNLLRRQHLQAEEELHQARLDQQAVQQRLETEERTRVRLLEETDLLTSQLRTAKEAAASLQQRAAQQQETASREREEALERIAVLEGELREAATEREVTLRRVDEEREAALELREHLQQAQRQAAQAALEAAQLQSHSRSLEQQLEEWRRALEGSEEGLQARQRELQQLRSQLARAEEELVLREGEFARREAIYLEKDQEAMRRESQLVRLQTDLAHVQQLLDRNSEELASREEQYTHVQTALLQREAEFVQIEQRIAHMQDEYRIKNQEFTAKEAMFQMKEEEFRVKEGVFVERSAEFCHFEEDFRLRQEEFKFREEEFRQSLAHKVSLYEEEIASLRLTISEVQANATQTSLREATLTSQIAALQLDLQRTAQSLTQQQTLTSQRDNKLLTLDQRIEAFEQEKEVLMQRLEAAENEQGRALERGRAMEELVRGRSALELELTTRQGLEQQLRAMLEEAASKEAHLEADIEQRELLIREAQAERKHEQEHYQVQLATLSRFVEELQEQLEQEKQGQESRLEEEARLREELEQEVAGLRVALNDLETRQRQEARQLQDEQSSAQTAYQTLAEQFSEEQAHRQHLEEEYSQLHAYQERLVAANAQQTHTIALQEQQLAAAHQTHSQLQQQLELETQRLTAEITELKALLEELRHERTLLERQEERGRERQEAARENELASFSFNHFEAEHAHPADHLNSQSQEERIRLSYSHTLDIASLQAEREQLLEEHRHTEQQLLAHQEELARREEELTEATSELQRLRTVLQQYEGSLVEKEEAVRQLALSLEQQRQSTDAQLAETRRLEAVLAHREQDYSSFRERHDQQTAKIHKQEAELLVLGSELQRMREAQDLRSVSQELERTKNELGLASQEVARLRAEIEGAFRQLENARREAEVQRHRASELEQRASLLEQRASEAEGRASEVEERRKEEEPHRILSRLSKRSNVSEQEEASKASSDGELSRRILNDPSKISGQESKFAQHLLVFENSKIHVAREPAEIAPERQIKEQRHEESVLSRQQQDANRTPDSHRTPTSSRRHLSNRPDDRSDSSSPRHSLTAIRQAEEGQEASLPPAQPSSTSDPHRDADFRPKEYLPQHSSRKNIAQPAKPAQPAQPLATLVADSPRSAISESKQHSLSRREQPSQQSNLNGSGAREEPSPQPPSFHRNSNQPAVPIYVARPEQQERSQSRSNSNTKVRISYGQPSDKSLDIRRREMATSQVSRVSMHSNGAVNGNRAILQGNNLQGSNLQGNATSLGLQENRAAAQGAGNLLEGVQVSPIQSRPNATHTPSIFSSQRRDPTQLSIHEQPPSQSIINRINPYASRISNQPRLPNAPDPRRESSPALIQPRIDTAYSPRHSLLPEPQRHPLLPEAPRNSGVAFNTVRGSLLPAQADPVRQESRKELAPSKIVMRSVIGGKRNSLLNDTATFGKNSQHRPLNETVSESNDSGIDVLQMDWLAPCCKND